MEPQATLLDVLNRSHDATCVSHFVNREIKRDKKSLCNIQYEDLLLKFNGKMQISFRKDVETKL